MRISVTPGMVRGWLCREGDVTPPFTMEELASAYLCNVQRHIQMQDAISDQINKYQESKEILINKIAEMDEDNPQLSEANRYKDYIDIFVQSLGNILLSCQYAGDWVQEYIKGWKESVEAHRAMYNKNHEVLLREQSELVKKTDYAFGTLRELRDFNPSGVMSLETYRKQVKAAAELALQRIESVRIQ